MNKVVTAVAASSLAAAFASAQTLDDLSITTLLPGAVVTGDTSTSTNDMDGEFLWGDDLGFWSGPDDVYTVIWHGGDFVADLFFTHADGDLDLWLLAGINDRLDSSLSTTDNEQVRVDGLAAGTYYLVIDGWQGASNTYTLAVIPSPAGFCAVIGLAALGAARRRRS